MLQIGNFSIPGNMFSNMFLGLFIFLFFFEGGGARIREMSMKFKKKKKRVQHLDENLEQLLLAFQDVIKGRRT